RRSIPRCQCISIGFRTCCLCWRESATTTARATCSGRRASFGATPAEVRCRKTTVRAGKFGTETSHGKNRAERDRCAIFLSAIFLSETCLLRTRVVVRANECFPIVPAESGLCIQASGESHGLPAAGDRGTCRRNTSLLSANGCCRRRGPAVVAAACAGR